VAQLREIYDDDDDEIFRRHCRQFQQQNFDMRVVKFSGTVLTQVAAVSPYGLGCNLICRYGVIQISA